MTTDPCKTLIVYKLNKNTNEKTLKTVFGNFGPVKSISVILNHSGKSRGYAFVEFKHKSDCKIANKKANGIKIDGSHIKVDKEKGQNDKNFRSVKFGKKLLGKKQKRNPIEEPEIGEIIA